MICARWMVLLVFITEQVTAWAGHGSPLGHWDRGFESHSGHGCLVCLRASFCVCVQLEALRRADHPPKESYRMCTYLLMELSPSGGAANSAATQEFPSIL
jgi:hypothetical protein